MNQRVEKWIEFNFLFLKHFSNYKRFIKLIKPTCSHNKLVVKLILDIKNDIIGLDKHRLLVF